MNNHITKAFQAAYTVLSQGVTLFANTVGEIKGLQDFFNAVVLKDWTTASTLIGVPVKNQREIAEALTSSAQNKGLVNNLTAIARASNWHLLSETVVEGRPVSVALIARLSRSGSGDPPKRNYLRSIDKALVHVDKLEGRDRTRAILSMLGALDVLGADTSKIDILPAV